jgi:Nif-specific regulatory protein
MVSMYLSEFVMREREGVLARDVGDDSRLIVRDSLGRINATSVICAPIRSGDEVFGLVHLYATREDRPLEPDDLEFTLAVAEQLAVALTGLRRQQELAANLTQMRDENQQLRAQLQVESELVGTSPAMRAVAEDIGRVAPSGATVLVRGESGVGKELVARAIHFSSARKRGSFVCLNCAALSESLLESELFGHEKGAFTGATDRKVGKFEAANKGTILLDEIGEMGPHMQAKFLRVLEGHPFERVGGTVPIQVDVRVVAATNKNLEKAVLDGHFRRDLYFRLRVVEIVVPPLRERREDIAILAEHFLDRFRQQTGRRIQGFTPAALARLAEYSWPGNVREVKNVVERAVVLARGPFLDVEDVLLSDLFGSSSMVIPALGSGRKTDEYRPVSLADLEREQIAAVLDANNWNKSQSAGILGIERSTLDRKIKRYKITRAKQVESSS